jgi:hypothetical protein
MGPVSGRAGGCACGRVYQTKSPGESISPGPCIPIGIQQLPRRPARQHFKTDGLGGARGGDERRHKANHRHHLNAHAPVVRPAAAVASRVVLCCGPVHA